MSNVQKVPTAGFSPYYGCAIMIMAVLIFGGILGWSAFSLFSQDKAIGLITQPEPVKLPPIDLSADARAALEKKLAAFAAAVNAGQKGELTLTLAELNGLLLLAPDSGYGTYTDLIRFTGADAAKNTLTASACLPMNNIKFWEDKKRYLIGSLTFNIHTHLEGVDAKVVDVKVPGKDVPEGFIGGMEIWPWIAPYRNVAAVGPYLKAIQKATVTAEGLSLSTQP